MTLSKRRSIDVQRCTVCEVVADERGSNIVTSSPGAGVVQNAANRTCGGARPTAGDYRSRAARHLDPLSCTTRGAGPRTMLHSSMGMIRSPLSFSMATISPTHVLGTRRRPTRSPSRCHTVVVSASKQRDLFDERV
jgi:hypothetical protein